VLEVLRTVGRPAASCILAALAVVVLVLSATHSHASSQTLAAPNDDNTLVLPQLIGPELPPSPTPLVLPTLPSAFFGCWQGDPGAFDSLASDAGIVDLGVPGKITFCYHDHTIEVPEANIKVTAGGRALDLLMHLGLGFSTFLAHGVSTDVFAVTSTQIHARTTLAVVQTEHWLYVIPAHTEQQSQVDWIATLVGPDLVLLNAQQVISNSGLRLWGTWHGLFHRIR